MANGFNAYQREMARRGLGSVFQTEGPERVGAGQRFTRSFDNREAGRANLTDVYGPDIPPYLMEDIFNVGGLLDQIVSAGSQAITPPITTADRRQQSAAIRREAGAPRTGLEEAEFFPLGLDPDKWQTPEDFVPFQPPEDWNVIEAQEPPEAGVPIIGEGPKKSILTGGRGTVVEQPGERAAAAADPIEQAFSSAMSEYINAARSDDGGVKVGSLEDYKKEFAEATGIDISGKPDKSAALMAFGLALMQNRAGKGFNVGKMLRAVGEAGEAALPALEKAKQEARNNAIAAGKYALEMRSADRTKAEAAKEKAMSRQNYYIVPKGEGVSGFLANMDKGSLQSLNVYELNNLQNNPDFASKYDIVPGSTWGSIVEQAMKAPEAQELYLTKNARDIPLFTGADDDLFKIRVYDPDPNKNPNARPVMVGDGQEQYEAFARMARDNERARQTLVELGVLNEGTSVFRYSLDAVNSLGSAFGITFSDEATPTQRMRIILEKMQAKNAPAILGEAGKTISDGDRERVRQIVGDVELFSDPRALAAKFEGLFNDIILGAEADIRQGLSTLNRYTGRNIGAAIGEGDLNEEERRELESGLRALGMM